jgi:Mn-dependent DtxR family transcriptional regulator
MLTMTQKTVLQLIKEGIKENGWPPTIKELAAATSVYPFAVQCVIRNLEKGGYITREKRVARGLRLTNKGKRS